MYTYTQRRLKAVRNVVRRIPAEDKPAGQSVAVQVTTIWLREFDSRRPLVLTEINFGGHYNTFTQDDAKLGLMEITQEHTCDSGNFDRTVCADPCGAMHSFCTTCGKRQDPCAHDGRDQGAAYWQLMREESAGESTHECGLGCAVAARDQHAVAMVAAIEDANLLRSETEDAHRALDAAHENVDVLRAALAEIVGVLTPGICDCIHLNSHHQNCGAALEWAEALNVARLALRVGSS